jgi:hypothetical protein
MNVDPFDPATLVRGTIATAILFAVIAFCTRATLRRIVGALIGSMPLIPMVMFYDSIASQLGWWHYPVVTAGSTAPLAWYIAAALFYGAGLGLIGWRVFRRFGSRGLIGFLIALAIFGATRDYFYSFTTDVIKFGPGPIPLIADLFAYASPAAVMQLVMYWIAGSPGSDPLARTPRAELKLSSRS